jgi:hypothetical protein
VLAKQPSNSNQEESDHILLSASLLVFDIEDGGSMFLRNVSELAPDYLALHPALRTSTVTEFRTLYTVIVITLNHISGGQADDSTIV